MPIPSLPFPLPCVRNKCVYVCMMYALGVRKVPAITAFRKFRDQLGFASTETSRRFDTVRPTCVRARIGTQVCVNDSAGISITIVDVV